MIYLGYDIMRQQTIACYKDQKIILVDGDRTNEIVSGLCTVGEKIPRNQSTTVGTRHGVEVAILIQTPWMYVAPYSDEAWFDLLSVRKL